MEIKQQLDEALLDAKERTNIIWLKNWKDALKKFFDEEENKIKVEKKQWKELFIEAIDEGIPFDALAELLVQSNIGVDIKQLKNELYLLAIKILKN